MVNKTWLAVLVTTSFLLIDIIMIVTYVLFNLDIILFGGS